MHLCKAIWWLSYTLFLPDPLDEWNAIYSSYREELLHCECVALRYWDFIRYFQMSETHIRHTNVLHFLHIFIFECYFPLMCFNNSLMHASGISRLDFFFFFFKYGRNSSMAFELISILTNENWPCLNWYSNMFHW